MTATVESIWETLASRLRSFIRPRVRGHAAAEDILQDAFVKVQRSLPSLKAGERIEAWVWRSNQPNWHAHIYVRSEFKRHSSCYCHRQG